MTLERNNGKHVHYPNNPDIFEFDSEVASHFGEMALRSIPMYSEVHRMHVAMMFHNQQWDIDNPLTIFDIGSSRGGLLKEVCSQCSLDPMVGAQYLNCIAVDSSPHMIDLLSCEMPWVRTLCANALDLPDFLDKADVISMLYLLQFVRWPGEKLRLLKWAWRNLKPGGMLILGQKEKMSDTYQSSADAMYYAWRRRNGYTDAEIEAKTRALQGSMWPDNSAWLEDQCYRAGFIDYTETTRWLQFSTSICTKGE